MRGVPRPGASQTLKPAMRDIEHVPSDHEPSDIPAWGLFPDDDAAGSDEDGPSVIPKSEKGCSVLLILMIFHLWVEKLLRSSLVFL